ncbi:Pr6Pr family membrane protein [Nocardioidaceae bacterium]|nr:Pr6Pr family membrane protein [Nocardioidaceae bacterium]
MVTATDRDPALAHRVRPAYALLAAVAWTGVVATVLISALDGYDRGPVDPGLYGDTARGAAGAASRVVDTLSYFTIWSNVVVAVAATLLVLGVRPTATRRVLLLASMLMITVTGVVYQVLLAPTTDVTGWSRLTDPILHVVVPVLTVVVWVLVGPRGWTSWRVLGPALLLPAAWIAWMLGRGAVIEAYPYGFVNVVDRGYGPVLTTIAQILVFGVVVGVLLLGIDRGLSRVRGRPGA